MQKRERLEKTFAGEATDRVPVALWRHWPVDDQRAAELAQTTVDFQKQWDWDFVKVSPADSYPLRDYGIDDEWHGTLEGIRIYTTRAVHQPDDWAKLARLDPTTGSLGEQIEALRLVRAGLGADVPVIATVFSPMAQAKNIAGPETMFRHMHQFPDAFRAGLDIIRDNTLRYVEALHDTGIDGIYYAVQHASFDDMTEDNYRAFGRPDDLRILESLPDDWWFNMAHIHGLAPMFDVVKDYPVQAMNWHDRETEPSLAEGMTLFKGAVSGGLAAWETVNSGTPESVREQARDAIAQTSGRRFILATGCVTLITSPIGNLRAVRRVVDEV